MGKPNLAFDPEIYQRTALLFASKRKDLAPDAIEALANDIVRRLARDAPKRRDFTKPDISEETSLPFVMPWSNRHPTCFAVHRGPTRRGIDPKGRLSGLYRRRGAAAGRRLERRPLHLGRCHDRDRPPLCPDACHACRRPTFVKTLRSAQIHPFRNCSGRRSRHRNNHGHRTVQGRRVGHRPQDRYRT